MKMMFLGAGSAFTPPDEGNFQSNMLITADSGKRLLIDCGTQVHMALKKYGFAARDIDALYVSHPHADHVGGMEEFGFKTLFDPAAGKATLYGNGKLLRDLWERTLSGGMGSLQYQITSLKTYFNVKPVGKNGKFTWEDQEFRLVQVVHFMDGYDIVPSYGLFFVVNGVKYFLTTDAQFAPAQILDLYKKADVIWQDCETTPYKSGVHAHFSELVSLPEDIRAKMWLYHYQPGPLPDAVAAGFRGFVKPEQEFTLGVAT
jgi:phosphoribosyl 1,2-cyclic phosphodiesterase